MTKQATIKDLLDSAIRLKDDVDGNPRYYIPVYMFTDTEGNMIRPKYCTKYKGKRWGAGWVFRSYNLAYDLKHSWKEG